RTGRRPGDVCTAQTPLVTQRSQAARTDVKRRILALVHREALRLVSDRGQGVGRVNGDIICPRQRTRSAWANRSQRDGIISGVAVSVRGVRRRAYVAIAKVPIVIGRGGGEVGERDRHRQDAVGWTAREVHSWSNHTRAAAIAANRLKRQLQAAAQSAAIALELRERAAQILL